MNSPLPKVVLCLILLLGGEAWAQAPTPIGPASWVKADGRIQRAVGPGGSTPTLNYQKGDGSWDYIVDEWVQVGDAQIWESVRGNHRVYADSTGAAIYAKGDHYLGTKTTHLIKFKKSDSTWTTLHTVNPDSVTMSGRTITFWGISPGINKTLTNNAKMLQSYTEQFEFTQVARDWLATKGPWANRLFGTATKLTVDSLNLSLRDAAGVFGINTTGRMVDGWLSLGSADTTAFYIATSYLETDDSVTAIPVKKWIVLKNGSPWLIELFDPIAAAALPAGTVRHNAFFGNQTIEAASGSLNDVIHADTYTMGSITGTMDSITAYITDGGGAAGNQKKYAVYETDGTLLGVTVEDEPGVDGAGWHNIPVSGTVNLAASTDYQIAAWANFATSIKMGFMLGQNTQRQIITYDGSYPDPESFINFEDTENLSIYVTYTETAATRRNKILKGMQ